MHPYPWTVVSEAILSTSENYCLTPQGYVRAFLRTWRVSKDGLSIARYGWLNLLGYMFLLMYIVVNNLVLNLILALRNQLVAHALYLQIGDKTLAR